jgi:clan AA aspartic protease (TIGR02281 family)
MNLRSLSLATMVLISGASFPAHGQTKPAQSIPLENALKNGIASQYDGHYSCAQGMTSLTIQLLKPEIGSQASAIFKFGPSPANPSVPFGAFLLRGTVNPNGGRLELQPLSWLSQPPGYVMVGLSGISSDRGRSFEGMVYGVGCTAFSINRVSISSSVSPTTNRSQQQPSLPPTTPSQKTSPPRNRASEIPLQTQNGVFVVPVLINGALTLNFMVDSGAADVSIPADVVRALMRTGTLQDADFLGQRTYKLADGSTVSSQTFRIRFLKVGDRQTENVTGSVAGVDGSLLLGQSFLSRFRSWSINNQRQVLMLD